MFFRVFGIGAAAVLGSLYMTGNLGGGSGVTYDRPSKEVYASLAQMKFLPDTVNMRTAYIEVDHEPDTQVRWRFKEAGDEILRITAYVEPIAGGAASSVTTSVKFSEKYEAKAGGDIDALNGLVEALAGEQIEAAIEQRPFDKAAAALKTAAYVARNRDALKSQIDKLTAGGDAARFGEYRPEQYGRGTSHSPSFRPGEPMIDVSR